MGDLLRTPRGERYVVLRTELFCLESVVLNRVKLLADSTRVFLPDVPNSLEVRAMRLSSLRQTLVHESLNAVLEQGVLVFYLCITVSFDTLELTQIFRVSRVWASKHFQFSIQFGYSFVVYPKESIVSNQKDVASLVISRLTCHVRQRIPFQGSLKIPLRTSS